MNQLELLWELENKKTVLEKWIGEYNHINNNKNIEDLSKSAINLEKTLEEIENNQTKNRILLKKQDKLLMEYNYKIGEMRKELYSGSITDLKQLDYINSEKESLKPLIDNIEFSILTLMDEIEKMELEKKSLNIELTSILKELRQLKKGNKVQLTKIENEIQQREDELNLVQSKIDLKLLNRFTVLRDTRQMAIVEVKDSICTGCNMRIPTYQIDIIKKKADIVYCQSCGRFLYYKGIEE
jgi:predicted  nucleic acid-binding Zn-ribbon protein